MSHVNGLALVAALLSLSACSSAFEADRNDRRGGGGRLIPVQGNLEHIARQALGAFGLDSSRQYRIERAQLCAVTEADIVKAGPEVTITNGSFNTAMQLDGDDAVCLSMIELRSVTSGATVRADIGAPTHAGWNGGYQPGWTTNAANLQALTYASQTRSAAGVSLEAQVSLIHRSSIVATAQGSSSSVEGSIGILQTAPIAAIDAVWEGSGRLNVTFQVQRSSTPDEAINATFRYENSDVSYLFTTDADPSLASDGGLVFALANGCRVGLALGLANIASLPSCAISGVTSMNVGNVVFSTTDETATFTVAFEGLSTAAQSLSLSFQDSNAIGTGKKSATEIIIALPAR